MNTYKQKEYAIEALSQALLQELTEAVDLYLRSTICVQEKTPFKEAIYCALCDKGFNFSTELFKRPECAGIDKDFRRALDFVSATCIKDAFETARAQTLTYFDTRTVFKQKIEALASYTPEQIESLYSAHIEKTR